MTELVLAHLSRAGGVGVEHRYARGAPIWEAGSRADSVHFLRRGQVAVKAGASEDGVIISAAQASEPFGELCFCSEMGGVHPTTARAVAESEVVQASVDDFLLFLEQSREALTLLLQTFCTRLTSAERRIEILSYRSAEDRVGRLLLQLASTRGEPVEENQHARAVEVTHEALAGVAVMNRSHVTVTMGKLRSKGLISYGRREPLIVYVAALADYLDRNSPG